jgi:hypothetical protein
MNIVNQSIVVNVWPIVGVGQLKTITFSSLESFQAFATQAHVYYTKPIFHTTLVLTSSKFDIHVIFLLPLKMF